MPTERKKLTVNLSPALVEVLKEMAEEDGTTMTESLKRAIEQRKYFLDKVKEGNEVGLIPEDPKGLVRLVDVGGGRARNST